MAKRKRTKFIKNTPSGKRALAGARSGTDRIKNPSGSFSSISTATFGIGKKTGPRGRTAIVPTVVKEAGGMRRLSPSAALDRAMRTGDFAVAGSQRVAERRSKKFSKRLGKITRKAAKRK